ncbi:M4 family metallopeptidase [Calidifontibacter indicus]|uniref:M4 family metallopeptidase n=1 Tax=Calidifontibacter indicus TaxID=419650 RepID=UPI003D7506DF
MKRTALGLVAIGSIAALGLGSSADAANIRSATPAANGVLAVAPATYAGQMASAAKAADGTAKAIGLGPKEKLVVKSVMTDRDGTTHTRYDRTYGGLPVIGGDLIVRREAAGRIVDTIWNVNAKVSLAGSLAAGDDAKAKANAVKHAAGKKQNGHAIRGAKATKTSKAVYLHEDGTSTLVTAVQTEGIADDQTPSTLVVWVDSASGNVVSSDQKVKAGSGKGIYVGNVSLSTTSSGGSYQLKNPSTGNYSTDLNQATTGNGAQFTDADDVWGTGTNSNRQSAAVDAQYGADATFGYYKNVLGRNGIWNNGSGARSRVHYGNSYVNAFWDGTQMTYGDGSGNASPLTELDVAAHEMSHGVTENTANLNYSGDAGGLNEATSDIFGTAVEWNANLASDTPDYYMGELININGNGTPLRYMDKPSRDGRSYDCWSTAVSSADPHYSSGPLNHWYYLASEGSGAKTINGQSYNSPTCSGAAAVTGAGHTNIEKVWYRTLSTKLTSGSNYKSAREGAINSAIELYGASSATCTAVEKAFDAIAVPKGTATCSGGTTPPPTGGELVTNGGFESGTTGWTGTSGPITNNSGQAAHGGTWKMWLGGNGKTTSENESQSVTIPSTSTAATLTYWVHVDSAETTTSSQYDKATVTVTPSGGSASTVASYSNLNKATGYKQVTVDLTAYKGKTITLKFSATEDSSLQTSFVFDDVSIKA